MNLSEVIKTELAKLGRLNKRNQEWVNIIIDPSLCMMLVSHPGRVSGKAFRETGETFLQRQIYNCENTWLDMELPICYVPVLRRIDLIGRDEKSFILTELKRKTDPDSVACLSALLQVIAYYQILVQNCSILDDYSVHHSSAKDSSWNWTEAVQNMRLQVRANKEFWDNLPRNTKYSVAVKNIIDQLKSILTIELVAEDGSLLYPDNEDSVL